VIPAGVRVYSNGVEQIVATQFGDVVLPESDSGVLPLVVEGGEGSGGIFLIGGNNAISGFEFDGSEGSSIGIFAQESANSIIENNLVSNSFAGIVSFDSENVLIRNNTTDGNFLNIFVNGSNNSVIDGNTVIDGGEGGIIVGDQTGATITNNQVENSLTSIDSSFPAPAGISVNEVDGAVIISGNTVTGSQSRSGDPLLEPFEGQGIAILNSGGSLTLEISNNTVTDNEGDGILVALGGDAQAAITIVNNIAQNNGADSPLRGDGIKIFGEEDSQITSLLIEGNTLTNNFDDGLDISLGLVQGVTIPGLGSVDPSNASITNATVQNNTINNNGGQGIILRSLGTNSNLSITVRDNTLTGNTGSGIAAQTLDSENNSTTRLCLVLHNNTSSNAITLTEAPGSILEVDQTGNTPTPTLVGGVNNGLTANCPN
jgi:trimeric autotransporter adhesin